MFYPFSLGEKSLKKLTIKHSLAKRDGFKNPDPCYIGNFSD